MEENFEVEQIKIAKEIEEAYNCGIKNDEYWIKIKDPAAFSLDGKGKITGHIYNLWAYAKWRPVNSERFKACVINALVTRGIDVFIERTTLIKDSFGLYHELYQSYGMIWEERDPRGAQFFADTSFEYHPKRTQNDPDILIVDLYNPDRELVFIKIKGELPLAKIEEEPPVQIFYPI